MVEQRTVNAQVTGSSPVISVEQLRHPTGCLFSYIELSQGVIGMDLLNTFIYIILGALSVYALIVGLLFIFLIYGCTKYLIEKRNRKRKHKR